MNLIVICKLFCIDTEKLHLYGALGTIYIMLCNFLNLFYNCFRFSSDIPLLHIKDAGDQPEASALRDEVCHFPPINLCLVEDTYNL